MYSKGFHLNQQPVNESKEFSSRILSYGPGLLVMEWHFFKKGAVTPMHSHYHEQITYVVKGSTEVELADGSKEVYKAGESIYFAPNEGHALVTMEDDTVCIDSFNPVRLDHLERHKIKE